MLFRPSSFATPAKGLINASRSTSSLLAWMGLSLALLNLMAQQVSAESLPFSTRLQTDARTDARTDTRSQPSDDSDVVASDIASDTVASDAVASDAVPAYVSSFSTALGSAEIAQVQLPSATADLPSATANCVASCNPNAPFVFHPPSEAIAPPLCPYLLHLLSHRPWEMARLCRSPSS